MQEILLKTFNDRVSCIVRTKTDAFKPVPEQPPPKPAMPTACSKRGFWIRAKVLCQTGNGGMAHNATMGADAMMDAL